MNFFALSLLLLALLSWLVLAKAAVLRNFFMLSFSFEEDWSELLRMLGSLSRDILLELDGSNGVVTLGPFMFIEWSK